MRDVRPDRKETILPPVVE